MFVDFRNAWPPPEPWTPKPVRPKLTRRQGKVMTWVIAFNLLMLFVGPLAGASLFDAVAAIAATRDTAPR